MASTLLLPLRIAQCVFSIVIIGLSGYVAHWYDADTLTASPMQINFLIFVPIFTIISLLYLGITSHFLVKASHPYANLTFEVLNSVFYFAGFVALSTFLGKLLFCRGSVCSAARADAVFAALSWVLWSGSAAISGMEIFKGGLTSRKASKTDAAARNAMNSMKEERPVGV